MTWEDYRHATCLCRERNHVAKAQLKLKLASSVEDNKKVFFFKYVNRKRKTRANVGPILEEDGHLTSRNMDQAEMLDAFFASVFNRWTLGPQMP